MMQILGHNLTANAVSALANVFTVIIIFIGVFVALRSIRAQTRTARFILSVDLLSKMDERFGSKGMKRIRREAARALLDRGEPLSTANSGNIDAILDFFETLGLMTRRDVLDEEMVWSMFFNWIEAYWVAAEAHIKSTMEENSEMWKDFKTLYERMIVIERTKTKKSYISLSPEEISDFLHDELILES